MIVRRASEAAFEPPCFTSRCLLTDVRQAVVKLDHRAGRALEGVARRVVIPPAVSTLGAALVVVGPHCIVK